MSSSSSDLTTSVTGTVFVYGSRQGVSHAQIAATFNVDPNDWAGVEFFFPQGVTVTKVECSYPQETSSSYATGSDHSSASVWWSPSVGSRVDIARSLTKVPSGGGSGTALIDVDIDEAVFDSHKAVFTVGVGEGEKGIYPDYVRFDVVFGDG